MIELGLGTWSLAGPASSNGIQLGWPTIDDREIDNIISVAIDEGLRVFDTSDFYGQGRAEKALGRHSKRLAKENIKIATKGGLIRETDKSAPSTVPRNFCPKYIQHSIDESLKRLSIDHIHIYQLHGPSTAALESNGLWELLERNKELGKIGSVGVSLRRSGLSDPNYLELARLNPLIEYVQCPLNPLADKTFVDNIRSKYFNGKQLLCRSPFFHGLLLRETPVEASDFGTNDHRRGLISPEFVHRHRVFRNGIAKVCNMTGHSERAILLGYSWHQSAHSTILVGASSFSQLTSTIKLARSTKFSNIPYDVVDKLLRNS